MSGYVYTKWRYFEAGFRVKNQYPSFFAEKIRFSGEKALNIHRFGGDNRRMFIILSVINNDY